MHEYAQTNLFENIAYDANHCENCDRIGFSSDIEKLIKNLPQYQGNRSSCEEFKLCARCEKAFYCSVKCNQKTGFF